MKKIIMLVAVLLLSACNNDTTNVIYEFPEGFEGEFAVLYNVKGEPALKKQGDYTVVPINEEGYYLTATATQRYGLVTDKYFYVDAQGQRTAIDERCVQGGLTGSTSQNESTINYSQGVLFKDSCEEALHKISEQYNKLDIAQIIQDL